MNREIGRGPVARVYVSGHSAVKVFPGRFDGRTLKIMRGERAKLAAAAEPILPYEIGLYEGKHALRMELCAESLAARVNRTGPLSSDGVADLYATLSTALSAAHRLGVCHGGISPTNVLLRASGDLVLADFGVVARQMFPRDPIQGIEWVPPETLRTGEVDARSDLYGLGATLHFALTGESPHPRRVGETHVERVLRILNDPVPAISRPDVPIRLSTTIARLLAPAPEHRRAPWQQPAPGPESSSPTRPRPWRWFAAAAVLVSAVILAAFVLWPRSTPDPRDTAGTTPTPSVSDGPIRPTPKIELDPPVADGGEVRLTWSVTGGPADEFHVYFWVEGQQKKYRPVHSARSYTAPVNRGRKYCFQIEASSPTDGPLRSNTQGINDANCET